MGVQGDTADLFHSHTSQNFAWIRTVLRGRRLQLLALQSSPDNRAPLPDVMEHCRRWINGQEQWLGKAITSQQRLDKHYMLLGALSFLLALVLAVAIGWWVRM